MKSGRKNSEEKVMRMGSGSIPKLVIEFAIPSIVGMVVSGTYNIISAIFLGQALGEVGLSTATVANPIMTMFMALAMLVGNGGNALAALKLGEGKRNDAEVTLGNTVFLGIVVGVVVTVLAMTPAALDALLTASSAPTDIRPHATVFIRILAAGLVFQIIGAGVNNFIRTAGAPIRALWTTVIGLGVSAVLNYLFVMVFDWGVAGSAWASVLGMMVSCVCVIWFFTKTKGVPFQLKLRNLRPHAGIIRKILALGFASFAVQCGMAVVNFVINHQIEVYGAMTAIGVENGLAAIGIVQRVGMFVCMPLIGVAVAIQPLLGFNYGARKIQRVRKTWLCGVILATFFSVVLWAFVHLFSTEIAIVFGITADGLVEFTSFALDIQMMMLPFVGFQIVSSNYFQATGQPLKSIFLTLTRQIIFLVPLLLIMPEWLPATFPQYTGLDAMYFATPVGDFLAIFTTLLFVIWEAKRLRKIERGELVVKEA